MDKAFFTKLMTQIKAIRVQVDKVHADAELALETLETAKGVTPAELEQQTRLLERLESVLECLDEAMHHCQE